MTWAKLAKIFNQTAKKPQERGRESNKKYKGSVVCMYSYLQAVAKQRELSKQMLREREREERTDFGNNMAKVFGAMR